MKKKQTLFVVIFSRSQRIVHFFPNYSLAYNSKHASTANNKHGQVLTNIERFLLCNHFLAPWDKKNSTNRDTAFTHKDFLTSGFFINTKRAPHEFFVRQKVFSIVFVISPTMEYRIFAPFRWAAPTLSCSQLDGKQYFRILWNTLLTGLHTLKRIWSAKKCCKSKIDFLKKTVFASDFFSGI